MPWSRGDDSVLALQGLAGLAGRGGRLARPLCRARRSRRAAGRKGYRCKRKDCPLWRCRTPSSGNVQRPGQLLAQVQAGIPLMGLDSTSAP